MSKTELLSDNHSRRINELEQMIGELLVVLLDGEVALEFDYKGFAKDHGYVMTVPINKISTE